jgi:hypothetical protein
MASHPGRAKMIDATERLDVRMSSDGKHLQLRLRDQTGQAVTFSLPACWLNTMLNAVPTSSGRNGPSAGQLEHASGRQQ